MPILLKPLPYRTRIASPSSGPGWPKSAAPPPPISNAADASDIARFRRNRRHLGHQRQRSRRRCARTNEGRQRDHKFSRRCCAPSPPPGDCSGVTTRRTTIGNEVVISYGLWQRRFGGDPAVLGKVLRTAMATTAVTIVGVLPKDFRLILPSEFRLVPQSGHVSAGELRRGADRRSWLPENHWPARARRQRSVRRRPNSTAWPTRLRATVPDFAAQKMTLAVFPLQADGVRDVRGALLLVVRGRRRWCCSSPASMSPICCSRARVTACAKHRSAPRSAPAAAGSIRQLLAESLVLGLAGGSGRDRRRVARHPGSRRAAAGILAAAGHDRTQRPGVRLCVAHFSGHR